MDLSSHDAILLSDSIDENQIAQFSAELSLMADAPLILCQNGERNQGLRTSLAAHGISFRTVPGTEPDSLLGVLEEFSRSSPARKAATPAADWEQELVGESAAIQHVREIIRLVAKRSCTVLITGESGTGKEIVARALHKASDRGRRPMVSMNCAAVPATLLETEMFGHVKGAFTGAVSSRIGRFEQAHQSTILLDEIGDTPLDLQVKILRALQEKEIHKVGGTAPTQVDARVLAATNRDLRQEIQAGRFRQDLFFRLNVIPLQIPPLRERATDIPSLVEHFLEKICRREGLAPRKVEAGVVDHLTEQAWPGNVRELEHAIERAIALSGDRQVLRLMDFSPFCEVLPLHTLASAVDRAGEGIDFEQIMSRLERALIEDALQRSSGNKARAAQMLGLKRSTLVSKVKAFAVCAG